jgi:hypothetical protein
MTLLRVCCACSPAFALCSTRPLSASVGPAKSCTSRGAGGTAYSTWATPWQSLRTTSAARGCRKCWTFSSLGGWSWCLAVACRTGGCQTQQLRAGRGGGGGGGSEQPNCHEPAETAGLSQAWSSATACLAVALPGEDKSVARIAVGRRVQSGHAVQAIGCWQSGFLQPVTWSWCQIAACSIGGCVGA